VRQLYRRQHGSLLCQCNVVFIKGILDQASSLLTIEGAEVDSLCGPSLPPVDLLCGNGQEKASGLCMHIAEGRENLSRGSVFCQPGGCAELDLVHHVIDIE
jgi:hypothetical protein